MADCMITFTKISFQIEAEITHVDVWFTSDDPVLTGTHRRRSFPASMSCVDIMQQHFHDVVMWP